MKDKASESENYGPAGGSICRNCARPFGRHLWMPNLLVGKLSRCPHCGKWQLARRASVDELKIGKDLSRKQDSAVEQTERSESADQRLKRQIDDSRFDE
jgi:hypothetical protein